MDERTIVTMKIAAFIIFFLCLIPIWNCNTKSSEPEYEKIIRTEEFFVTWHGEYEVDGCGFIMHNKLIEFKASNEEFIGVEFKSSEMMRALIEYEDLKNKFPFSCGDYQNPIEYSMIKLLSIEKIKWP